MLQPVPKPEVCEHLRGVLDAVLADGARITYAGQAWSRNCRMWVYVDRALDLPTLRARLPLASCVHDHEHRGTHDGCERGLECSICHDGVMGLLPLEPPGNSSMT